MGLKHGRDFLYNKKKGTRFQDIPKLLPPPSPKNEDTLQQCKHELIRKLSSTDWENKRMENIGAEVEAILQMAHVYGEILIDDAVVTALFQTNNFILPVGDLTLGLLHYLITLPPEMDRPGLSRAAMAGLSEGELEMMMEGFEPKPRKYSASLERAVCAWINRLFNVGREGNAGNDASASGSGGTKKRSKRGLLSGLARGLFSAVTATDAEGGAAIPELSLSQTLEAVLRWWQENCARLQGEKNKFYNETEWVIQCHFSTTFLTSVASCKEYLKEISLVAKSKVQPIISRAYVSSLRSATTQISGEETIRLLYPDLKTISSKQQKSYTIWQKCVHRDVIEQVLRNSELLRNSDNPKKKKKKSL